MPLNLDSCIAGIFIPGNIGASSGQTPIVRVMPPRLPDTFAVQIHEVVTATAVVSVSGDIGAVVTETAAAIDVVAVSQILDEGIAEVVFATDAPSVHVSGVFAVTMTETAAAADVVTAAAVSAEVAAFLARTSGLDATHINAYTALIDGLVADGIWTKLDVLRIYATQNSTTALLNLKSSSYGGVITGSPTFTADRGFVGSNATVAVTMYIDSGFIPTTAPSPQFTLNSAHISVWNLTNATSVGVGIGCNSTGAGFTHIHPKFTDNNAYFRVNGTNTAGVAMSDPRGHFIANRSASNAVQGYKNGSSVLTNSDTSAAGVSSVKFLELANNNNGAPNNSTADQIAAISIGSSLSSTNATNFYNRLRTYMTAVGVP